MKIIFRSQSYPISIRIVRNHLTKLEKNGLFFVKFSANGDCHYSVAIHFILGVMDNIYDYCRQPTDQP
ncbi:hypothetical protein DERF_010162 [Dermatophagoides farinae]|uniref:Uncharacterized protein n=1 Tax=Dermatophagoides farinae TaxID=6954 RepID=A0A922HYD7_DERFA|nr:hypothetical protein DERF_010162 [Dermatophagoides farinae]